MLNWWGLGSSYQENPAIGWMLVTFGIFVAILYHFLKKPMADFLKNRSDEIRLSIQKAQEAHREAQEQLLSCEKRLAEIDAEIAQMKARFKEQGELERACLKEEAEKIAAMILKEAEQSLKAEVSRALQALKREVALKILNAAQEELSTQPIVHQKLMASFANASGRMS